MSFTCEVCCCPQPAGTRPQHFGGYRDLSPTSEEKQQIQAQFPSQVATAKAHPKYRAGQPGICPTCILKLQQMRGLVSQATEKRDFASPTRARRDNWSRPAAPAPWDYEPPWKRRYQ